MNALQDPSKKGSINSLLNPQEASTYSTTHLPPPPLVANQSPSHPNPTVYEHAYGPNSSYHLRTADWEPPVDPSRRKVVNTSEVQHPSYWYPQPQPHSAGSAPLPQDEYTYPPSSQENMRSRSDSSYGYVARDQSWDQQRHLPGPTPSYSQVQRGEPSPALSRDYPNQSSYSTYGDQGADSGPIVWQSADRASVRLAAKNTEYPQTAQGYQYTETTAYYGQQNTYSQSVPLYPQPSTSSVSAVPPLPVQPIQPSAPSTSASSKRPLPDTEGAPAPVSKRAKSKAKATASETPAASSSSTVPSKRGYNAKKRSEAAIISAQNGKLDALQRSQGGGRGQSSQSGDIPYPTTVMADGEQYIPELQFARCMSNRYKLEDFPRCVSCTRRWAGDTCRFQGIRYFMRDAERKLCGVSFNERTPTQQGPPMDFPKKWNRKFEKEHATRSKLSIAKALLPTLVAEQYHMQVEEIVRRARESDVRATCDTCMTSLFSTSFMCRICGREVCNECYQNVRELTDQPEGATPSELNALSIKREKYAHANPFFLSCTRRNEHGVSEFTPVTRFMPVELDKAITQMRAILEKDTTSEPIQNDPPMDQSVHPGVTLTEYRQSLPATTELTLPVEGFPDPVTSPVYDDFTPSNAKPHTTSTPIYRAQVIPAALYDPPASPPSATGTPAPVFSKLWRSGMPLLVKDVLPRFKVPWTPQYFTECYGDNGCLIVECQTETVKRVTVRDFFGWFGKYEGRTECWKLKDWPHSADFKTEMPALFKDFSEAVPAPDYVRRDGVYNIGSHFPSNAIGPDLGPKMYNAMASSEEVGSKGSTRLHMDMADALNVMLHAEPCEDGTEGYAVWDLFRAEDSDLIRAFLKKRFAAIAQQSSADGKPNSSAKKAGAAAAAAAAPGGGGAGDKAAAPMQMGFDPIHGQQFYLDVELRRLLFEETGVKSFRIYQRPGDGVFIPAGCAHQVANMSDCMKIAIDFVSPENIDRCEKLTKEFREQNQSKVWKEDVLQLRTMMWFAWQSACIQEEILAREEEASNLNSNMDNITTTLGSAQRVEVDGG